MGEMSMGRRVASLLDKILEIILKEKFRRLMGLKLLKVDGLGFFGMSEKRKQEEALRRSPEEKNFCTAATTEEPTISQQEV